ncbi:unnamed protein product [Ilex paraguariensis]|uniref:Peptidase metallopeptidase domain-containing protein n=1 Tax=Ilex paraguariensis TaxID=185542 RepID=A0ABC8RUP3_9AQUA
MATIIPKLFSFISLLVLLLPLLAYAKVEEPKKGDKKPSPFEFIKHLQGCHKGEKVKGLNELKKYLNKFGYLNYPHSENQTTHAHDDDFDNFLQSAIKTYQLNYHLNATGNLDGPTVSKMVVPRCGVADIINDGPAFHLTYGFLSNTHPDAMGAVARAFEKWASVSHFTFTRTGDFANADIKIGFHRGDHGDGNPFDGRGGVLAHSWPPTDGRFHYDADEVWSVGPVANAFDLETVALHEIGHLLGLGHSSVQDAIMFSGIPPGVTKGLHGDDIDGIKALYNV